MVFGVSSDSPEENKAFAEANRLPFLLLTDPSSIIRKVGVGCWVFGSGSWAVGGGRMNLQDSGVWPWFWSVMHPLGG